MSRDAHPEKKRFAPSAVAEPQPSEPSEFRVSAPAEIIAYLRILQTQACRINLSTPAGQNLSTTLIAVDEPHAGLAFEVRSDAPELQDLISGTEVSAVAYLDQIRLQFDLDALMLVKGSEREQARELRAALPSQMFRFQRRQAFRVRPNTRTPHVRLKHPTKPDQELRLRILDLSLGGVALLLPPEHAPFPTGFEWVQAQIELDRETRINTGLRLQSDRPCHEPNTGRQLGLLFTNMDMNSQLRLQRFIDQTQKLARMLSKSKA
ncbi:flagellar brake protein [Roseateles sp.]|uniref:flagellar brake protein n=1 Tax=Roseateles sp. TaxID=1971397 RepID=UPI003BA5DA08